MWHHDLCAYPYDYHDRHVKNDVVSVDLMEQKYNNRQGVFHQFISIH